MSFDPLELPQVAAWRAGFGGVPDSLDFLGQHADATLAVAFTTLFWPRFREVRGCVMFAEFFDEERFEQWFEQLDGDCSAIESTVNHVHLWDTFDAGEDLPAQALRHLAEVLAKTWRCALREQFPGRAFAVHVSDEPDDYGPTIRFHSLTSG